MAALAEKTCTPCRGGVPPLTRDEAEQYREQAPDRMQFDNATRIERTDRFKNIRVMAFGLRERGSAPDKGLHENDFIMAAKRNRIVAKNTVPA